jgi:hypothetical protein
MDVKGRVAVISEGTVILSEAKDLAQRKLRFFAALRMTDRPLARDNDGIVDRRLPPL